MCPSRRLPVSVRQTGQSVVVSGHITMASDPVSFSSFTRCATKHLNLSLHVDFDRHVIKAKVELTVEALEDRFSALVT